MRAPPPHQEQIKFLFIFIFATADPELLLIPHQQETDDEIWHVMGAVNILTTSPEKC
jgi:hypothetical protein